MYFTIHGLLFLWFWRVEALHAWGLALTKTQAKDAARRRIMTVRPDASQILRV